jgi:hypothetical protein
MAKKKVSKKVHRNSISRHSKTDNFSRKTKSISRESSKPAAELLNIQPPINATPNAAPQVQQPEIRVQPVPQIIGPTPIDTANVKAAEPKKDSELPKILAIIVCGIILLFWISIVVASTHINFGPKIEEKNVSYISYVPINNSFDNWKNANHTPGEIFMQQGFLREEVVQVDPVTKTTTYYIVDDYGNKIKLKLDFSQQQMEYKKLFVINNNTRGTYNITGTVDINNGYIINVGSMNAQPKSLNIVTRIQVQNVTTESSGIKFDLYVGWQSFSRMLFGEKSDEES